MNLQSVDAAECNVGARLQPRERARGKRDRGDAAHVVGDVQRRFVGRQRRLLRRREFTDGIDARWRRCVGREMKQRARLTIRYVNITGAADRRRAWEDVQWALLNSKNFAFNH